MYSQYYYNALARELTGLHWDTDELWAIQCDHSRPRTNGYFWLPAHGSPHGFGLSYNEGEYGVDVNRLTKKTHRDPIAGTPLHRYVRCKIKKL